MSSTSCNADAIAFERLAAALPLAFNIGDDFPLPFRVNRDLAEYELEADLINADTGSVACSFAVTQTPIDVSGATHTQVNLDLTDEQTSILTPQTKYRWSFRWTSPEGITRTVLSGPVRAARR